jgi:predicted nucleic acid-binding protein
MKASARPAVRFWDVRGIVPLLVAGPARDLLLAAPAESGHARLVGMRPECVSALARKEREGAQSMADVTAALERLRALADAWQEIVPAEPIRTTAERLLRVHPLRAADSLQLAAAIIAAEREPATLEFVSLDERLGEAASREGFRVGRG